MANLMTTTRRNFLKAVAALPAVPVLANIPTPTPTPEPIYTPEAAESFRPVYHTGNWAEMPASGDIRPGQLLSVNPDGYVIAAVVPDNPVVGVALARLSKKTWQVALNGF